MKRIYCIRHAKAKDFENKESDFERALSKKGFKQINTIGSYLKLAGITPECILSSCALRAQETATQLAKKIEYQGKIAFLEQLYMASAKDMIDILKLQEDEVDSLFIIGHHPYLTELSNLLTTQNIAKIPTMGVLALEFAIDSWSELETTKGEVSFFIFPKQFKYYMPKQIRSTLSLKG